MDLYLMRHGIAVPREENPGLADAQRPLTEEGVRKTEQVAQGLVRLGIACDWILTSPLVRARQTAEITAKAFGLSEQVEEWSELGTGGPNEALIHRLQEAARSRKLKGVLLVGHEPQLSELTALLLAGTRNLSIDFKKAGVCCLEIGAALKRGEATLRWFLAPKQLSLLGQD